MQITPRFTREGQNPFAENAFIEGRDATLTHYIEVSMLLSCAAIVCLCIARLWTARCWLAGLRDALKNRQAGEGFECSSPLFHVRIDGEGREIAPHKASRKTQPRKEPKGGLDEVSACRSCASSGFQYP